MHYDSNKKLYVVGLCVFIIITGFIIGHIIKSDNFQSLMYPRNVLANTYNYNTGSSKMSGVLGDKDNLVSFSILPNTKVHGVVSYRGTVSGGYFFEGNVIVNVLDIIKHVSIHSNATATTDWMTNGPVEFEGNLDFTGLVPGPGWIEIQNDNPSGEPPVKKILIPIVIE